MPCEDDPKKLIRCPGKCGNELNFTMISKCARCGTIRCPMCMKRHRKRLYCKPCRKQVQREDTR